MEYFDFAQAAGEDDFASDCPDLGDADSVFTGDNARTDTIPTADGSCSLLQVLVNTNGGDGLKQQHPPPPHQDPTYPMHRAEEPCFFCRSMGLDCFVAQRGVMQENGCTCCIALYRKCSFTHAQPQGKFINTLHVVGEDAYIPTGSLTGEKALKSFSGPSNGPLQEDSEARQKKTGARFSRDAVKVLKSWLSDHVAHPYPTDEEKADLKEKTGLKRSQISNWLANARRRGKVRPPPQIALGSDPIPIPGKTLPPGVDMSELTPLERWKHSPPEHEPASPRDIIQAMATTSFAPGSEPTSGGVQSNSRRTGSTNDDSSFSAHHQNARPTRSSSGYSLETMSKSSLSDMSFASAFSHRSSHGSYNSKEKRDRRRRRHKTAVGTNTFQKARGARVFQCTFCTDSFATKYDWQRHEKSLHLALEKWTCAPHGGVVRDNDKLLCAFCRQVDPDEDHLEAHNFSTCQEKSIQERTFYRKDHLNQHLRLMHNAKLGAWMDQWKSTISEIISRCGFCGTTFYTWKDRVDHVAAHYKGGTQICQWRGDWGFEPHVQKLVENAMPPYLIGEESRTLDPFVAHEPPPGRRGTGDEAGSVASSSPGIPVPSDVDCFRRLETGLTEYIRRALASGEVPTDQMLQAEARKIIYETDDPWNQTCADNPAWLAVIKRNAGICDVPIPPEIQLEDLGMQPPFAARGLHQTPAHTLGAFTTRPAISPTYPSTTFHSTAPSLASSLAASSEVPFGMSSFSWLPMHNKPAHLSSSAPVTVPSSSLEPPPPHHLEYDPDFLQGLGDGFPELRQGIDDMQLGGVGGPQVGMDLDHTDFSAAAGKHPSTTSFEPPQFGPPLLPGQVNRNQRSGQSYNPHYQQGFNPNPGGGFGPGFHGSF